MEQHDAVAPVASLVVRIGVERHGNKGSSRGRGACAALSPELDRRWLLPLRQLRVRLTHPLRGGSGVPLLASVQQLQLSEAYRRVAPLLRSDVQEHWDDGEWRFVGHA
ncbi:hypothetical protein ACFY2R_20225 [Micromonospora olivasterospora]|uniref:hypothetical protein n=1 Tax=Micromonospora olivasterospora TaxID=1880 RepID=UPI001B86C6E6|nr:hypothetical protein [Micromonospora olivasterospora]